MSFIGLLACSPDGDGDGAAAGDAGSESAVGGSGVELGGGAGGEAGDAARPGGGDAGSAESGDPPPPQDGIYAVVDVTQNDDGCEAEGDSIRAMLGLDWLFIRTVPSADPHSWVVLCEDVETCNARADEVLELDRSSGESLAIRVPELQAFGFRGGGAEQGACSADVIENDSLTVLSPDEVRIEARSFAIPTHPAVDDACTFVDAYALLDDAPCFRIRVITATFAEPFESTPP